MRLAGRHAIVTGGGTGIGAAIAAALEAEGATVSRIGRRQKKLGATGFAADVTDRAEVEAAFAAPAPPMVRYPSSSTMPARPAATPSPGSRRSSGASGWR